MKNKRKTFIVLFCLYIVFISFGCTKAVYTDVVYVSPDGKFFADGSSLENAVGTLSRAINIAGKNNIKKIAVAGTITGDTEIRSFAPGEILIYGLTDINNPAVIRGKINSTARVLNVSGNISLMLENISITGGDNGGLEISNGATVIMGESSKITQNFSASSGACISITDSTLIMKDNSEVSYNTPDGILARNSIVDIMDNAHISLNRGTGLVINSGRILIQDHARMENNSSHSIRAYDAILGIKGFVTIDDDIYIRDTFLTLAETVSLLNTGNIINADVFTSRNIKLEKNFEQNFAGFFVGIEFDPIFSREDQNRIREQISTAFRSKNFPIRRFISISEAENTNDQFIITINITAEEHTRMFRVESGIIIMPLSLTNGLSISTEIHIKKNGQSYTASTYNYRDTPRSSLEVDVVTTTHNFLSRSITLMPTVDRDSLRRRIIGESIGNFNWDELSEILDVFIYN